MTVGHTETPRGIAAILDVLFRWASNNAVSRLAAFSIPTTNIATNVFQRTDALTSTTENVVVKGRSY